MKFHTDSKVVLGYLNNRSRRFYNYVCNRVNIIHQRSKPEQWNYVSSENNPADIGTRPIKSVTDVLKKWISGPHDPTPISERETVEFRVWRDGKCVSYVRPVTELVPLIE